MSTAKADYICGACLDAGHIDEPFRDLPVMSKVCPVCAEPTLERVWSPRDAPNVTTGMATRLDQFTRGAHEEAERRRPERPTSWRDPTVRAVPVSGLGRAMSDVMQTEIHQNQATAALGLRGDKAKVVPVSPFRNTFGSQINAPQPIVVGRVERGAKP